MLAEIDTPEVDRQLAQARADLATAQANLALSNITNERWQGLLKTQAVSKQDADDKAGDAAAKAATVESAQQNVERLSDLESFKHVLAPFDGVVTARNTDVGDLINAGQATGTELFRLADIHRLRIYAQVPEAYAASTGAGLKAELHFAERPGKVYEADTIRTSNALDPTARTLQVELQLDNREAQLFPGAYAEIHFKLPVEHPRPCACPPTRCCSERTACRSRWSIVRISSGSRKIEQGRDFGKTVEVLIGIGPDDEVIVNPPDSIEDGLRVRIARPPGGRSKRGALGGPMKRAPRGVRRRLRRLAPAPPAPPARPPSALSPLGYPPRARSPRATRSPTAVPPPPQYKELADWTPAQPRDSVPRGAWWSLYHDPQLDRLEDKVHGANWSLKAAVARLDQARAQYRIARADLFPTLTAAPYATRERFSPNAPKSLPGYPTLYNDFLLGADFSYEVDLWGRVRNEVAAARASRQASAADLALVELSLRAQLAEDYFNLRAYDAQRDLLDRTVGDYAKSLELTTNLFNGGAAALADVAQAQAQLDNARTQAADIRLQRAQAEHAIAVLVGENPSIFNLPANAMPQRYRSAAARSRYSLDASRTPARHRGGGASRRGRQRPDRRRARRLLSEIHACGNRRIREHAHLQSALGAEPVLVGRAAGLPALVRGRPA